MKDEYISLSIAGAFGVWGIGLVSGLLLAGDRSVAANVIIIIMLLLVVRADARVGHVSGNYQRGWFVWRRTGPVTRNDPEAHE